MEGKILIIDDDRDICQVLGDNLTWEGYEVDFSFNGLDGIEKLKKNIYDLVILDLRLPDIHGSEVLGRIRDFNDKVSIIVLTGYPDLDSAIESVKNHASEYLIKPFKVSQLKIIIEKEMLKTKARENFGTIKIANIGERIKELRKKGNLTLDDLAERTSLSKSFLSEVERKKKFPRLSTLQTIAQELGVNLNLIIEE